LDIYLRNDKPTGVKLNRKFRFSTLGYTRDRLKKLDLDLTFSQRERELEEIKKQQEKKKQIEK
jgi:hypothetical protein